MRGTVSGVARLAVAFAGVAAVGLGPVMAQESLALQSRLAEIPSSEAGQIIVIASDGFHEGLLTPSVDSSEQEYAGQIRLGNDATVKSFGACFTNTGSSSELASLEVRLYEDDVTGPADAAFAAASGSFTFEAGQSACVEASGDVAVPRTFWVATSYDSVENGELALWADTNGFGDELVNRRGGSGFWSDVLEANGAALYVRIPSDAGSGTGPCSQDLANGVICLRNGRFELTMETTNFEEQTEAVIFEKQSDEVALGVFSVNPNDTTVVAKVTNGCPINGNFWVWLGAFTAAELRLTVRDTTTGRTKTYGKPLGGLMTTIKDDSTFPCS